MVGTKLSKDDYGLSISLPSWFSQRYGWLTVVPWEGSTFTVELPSRSWAKTGAIKMNKLKILKCAKVIHKFAFRDALRRIYYRRPDVGEESSFLYLHTFSGQTRLKKGEVLGIIRLAGMSQHFVTCFFT
jgi:hypothetical protein